MPKQQLFTILITLLMGMLAGAYLYVSGFASTYNQLEDGGAKAAAVFTLQAEQFGGCGMVGTCPSFQLIADRTYRYIPGAGDVEVYEGKLSKKVFDQLGEMLLAADFSALNQPGSTCRAAFDGTDYQYEIIADGVLYELNTCNTQFTESALDEHLQIVWQEIISVNDTSGSEFKGAAEVLVDRFGEE